MLPLIQSVIGHALIACLVYAAWRTATSDPTTIDARGELAAKMAIGFTLGWAAMEVIASG